VDFGSRLFERQNFDNFHLNSKQNVLIFYESYYTIIPVKRAEIWQRRVIMVIENGFEIENGVLVKYNGFGGDVVIPEGVTGIGEKAFGGCFHYAIVYHSISPMPIIFYAGSQSPMHYMKLRESPLYCGTLPLLLRIDWFAARNLTGLVLTALSNGYCCCSA
jgi:hypothetical protein